MLPGDVDVWEAVPIPQHAVYVCKNCIYCSVQDRAGGCWSQKKETENPGVQSETPKSEARSVSR